MTSRDLCLTAHDDRERLAAPGLRLCHGCRDRLERHVAELPALYRECELALAGTRGKGDSDPVTHRRDPGLVLSIPAMQAREHVRVELSSWVRIGLDEGPWDQAPADTITAMAVWIVGRLDWYAARDYADEVARTFADTHAEAWSAAYPSGASRIDIAACVEDECAGMLSAYVRSDDDLLPAVIRCSADAEHAWASGDWRSLERRITAVGYDELRRVIGG